MGIHDLTWGELKRFVDQMGFDDDTLVYVERDRDSADEHTGAMVYEEVSCGVRAEIWPSGGGHIVLCIDHG